MSERGDLKLMENYGLSRPDFDRLVMLVKGAKGDGPDTQTFSDCVYNGLYNAESIREEFKALSGRNFQTTAERDELRQQRAEQMKLMNLMKERGMGANLQIYVDAIAELDKKLQGL